jgi:protein-S-isoprenylcysteine O-methyltransferase Ste14
MLGKYWRLMSSSRILTTWVFALTLFLLLLLGKSYWDDGTELVEGSLFLLGVWLMAIGVVGRAWSLAYIAGNKGARLVTSGPYSLCRHPLYFSNLLGALGLGFSTETVTIPLIIIGAFALYYPFVIRKEEDELKINFGFAYDDYCVKVRRFFPSFRSFHENEHVLIAQKPFRAGVVNLAYFILLIGVLEFLEVIHRTGLLPTLFNIY